MLTYSFFWFFVYIGFVYLARGFIFSTEIPRLIILYTYIIATTISILVRYTIYTLYSILYTKKKIKKELILVITTEENKHEISEDTCYSYRYIDPGDSLEIENIIRTQQLECIIYLGDHGELGNIFTLARIYGITLLYPQISRYTPLSQARENWIGGIPMIELRAVAITAW